MFCPRNYRNYATQILSLFVAVILDTVTGVLPTWIESVSGGENNCSSRFVWDASKAFAAQSASQPRPASQPASHHHPLVVVSRTYSQQLFSRRVPWCQASQSGDTVWWWWWWIWNNSFTAFIPGSLMICFTCHILQNEWVTEWAMEDMDDGGVEWLYCRALRKHSFTI